MVPTSCQLPQALRELEHKDGDQPPKTGQDRLGGQEGPTSSREGPWEAKWLPAATLPPQHEFQSCPLDFCIFT